MLNRLETDSALRRICGWERKNDVPDEWTFSRAFAEFSKSHLPERVHEAFIKESYAGEIVGHNSRDSTDVGTKNNSKGYFMDCWDSYALIFTKTTN